MKTKYHHLNQSILVTIAALGLGLVAATPARAGIYYWDPDGSGTPGFGTASGTWGTDAFWGTDATGSGATANTTITTADDVHFGTADAGLAAGTIAGPATAQGFLNMTFGAASGAITITGGRLDLNAGGSTITVNNTENILSAILQGADGKLIKSGDGRLILRATQTYTYTGETVVDQGTLVVEGNNTLLSGLRLSSGITINDGGTVLVNGDNALHGYDTDPTAGTVVINQGGKLTAANGVTAWIRAALELNGSELASGTADAQYGTWTFGADVIANGAVVSTMSAPQMNWRQATTRTFLVNDPDGTLNVTGTFARPAAFPGAGGPAFTGSMIKDGPGAMVLRGANTYTGSTTINDGMLSFGTGGSARNSSGFLVGAGATMEVNAVNVFVLNHTTPVAAARVIAVDGGTLLMTANSEARIGNVTLSNGATWTSDRSLVYYDILLADTDSGPATVSVTGNAASVMDGNGGIHLEGVQNFDVAEVTGNTDADLVVSMILANRLFATPAAGGIAKSGAGMMLLDNTNTYTGPTTIHAGTLAIGTLGSIASSTVSIAAGATLDTSALATFTCPPTLEFGLDASGSSGQINAAGSTLAISGSSVTFNVNGPLTAPSYVLATYGSLSDAPNFASVSLPTGYGIAYDFNGGTQIALVHLSDPFQSWVATPAFGLAPADQGPTADPDFDGMDNLLEFVLNGHPAVSDPSILPDLVVTDDHFEFTYVRREDSLSPVTTQTFQYGTDLDGWTDVIVPSGSDVVGMATITVIDGSPADTVKISIPKSEAGLTGKLFGRLQVTRP